MRSGLVAKKSPTELSITRRKHIERLSTRLTTSYPWNALMLLRLRDLHREASAFR